MSNPVAYWGFPIDQELHAEAQATIGRINLQPEQAHQLGENAAKVVCDLTDSGLHSYYRIPVDSVPMHPRMRKTADSGIKVVMSAIHLAIRQFFKKRSSDEMAELASYLDAMLWVHPEREQAYLVFSLTDELHQRALQLIQQVREDDNYKIYVDDIVDTLCELVEHSVVHYYQTPSDKIGLRGLTRKTIDLGINGAQKGIRSLIDKLVREIPHKHLVALSFHIESMILRVQ